MFYCCCLICGYLFIFVFCDLYGLLSPLEQPWGSLGSPGGLELAQEVERRGYAGIYCASVGDGLGLCLGIALATERIPRETRGQIDCTKLRRRPG